jgi:hypothetical protein
VQNGNISFRARDVFGYLSDIVDLVFTHNEEFLPDALVQLVGPDK